MNHDIVSAAVFFVVISLMAAMIIWQFIFIHNQEKRKFKFGNKMYDLGVQYGIVLGKIKARLVAESNGDLE